MTAPPPPLRRRAALLALAASPAAPGVLRAQGGAAGGWPASRPIEVLVGFSAGGGVDIMTRAVTPFLAKELPGARFVVLNRPGAGGQLASEATANAAPDGFTIGATSMPGLVSQPVERPVRYRIADLTFLANVVDDPCALFVRPDHPLKSLAELIAAGRARPEHVTYGTTGVGSDDHLTMFRLEAATGARFTQVPFPGVAPLIPQVLSGQVDIGAMNVSEALPFVREGRLRGLGQAGVSRWAGMPDLPTYREQGVEVVGSASRGFVAPGGLPEEVAARLVAAFRAALSDPAFLREAERLSMPLRPVFGAEYRAEAMALDGQLRALWAQRPWTQS